MRHSDDQLRGIRYLSNRRIYLHEKNHDPLGRTNICIFNNTQTDDTAGCILSVLIHIDLYITSYTLYTNMTKLSILKRYLNIYIYNLLKLPVVTYVTYI